MVQVAPSILSADFANLERDCRKVLTGDNPILHVDVMDGVFVPNISIGVPVLASLSRAIPNVFYDVHLMIVKPEQFIAPFQAAGANGITVHFEAQPDPTATLRAIRALGCRAGLSLRPATPAAALFPYLKEADLILVMSVEPGFGGQAFIPSAVEKIAALRAEATRQNTPLFLQVDGGITPETAKPCIRAGVDILVAGSAVFHAPNPAAAVQQLTNSA